MSSERREDSRSSTVLAAQRVLADSHDAILVLDHAGSVQYANPAARVLFGERVRPGTIFGTPASADGTQELDVRGSDGELVTVEMRVGESYWNDEPAQVVTLRDVTRRNADRTKLKQLNRVLQAIRAINQLIVREKDPATLLQLACAALVRTRGYQRAWIAAGDGKQPTAVVAQAGWSEDGFRAFSQHLARGHWPACVGKACAVEDGLLDVAQHDACDICPLTGSSTHGTEVVATLRHRGTLRGALGVVLPGNIAADQQERALLGEVAGDIAFALHDMEAQQRREVAERETQALLAANRAVLTSDSFEQAARTIFDICKQQTGATAGYVALRQGEDENGVLFLDAGGTECTVDPSLPMPIRGLRAEAYHQNRTVFHNDFAASPHQALLPAGHAPLTNVMFVPISHQDRVEGIIGLANKPGGFTDEEARRAHGLGEVAALALQRERHLEQLVARDEMLLATGRMARVGGWEVDLAAGEVSWSAVTREIHEVDQDYVPSLDTAVDFFHPDDRPALQAALSRAMEHGEPYDLELRFITARGRELWTHTRCAPVLERGRVVRLVGTFQDITQRRLAEEALVQRERLLGSITDNMQDMVSVATLDGRAAYVSPSHRQLGYEPEELQGKQVTDLVHPDDLPEVQRALQLMLQTGGRGQSEYRHRRADGSYAWLESFGQVLTDPDGQPEGVIFSTRNVTDRKLAAEQLARSEQRFRALFEHSLAPIVITDDAGNYLDVNAAACTLLGYDRDTLLSMNVGDLRSTTPESAAEQFSLYRSTPGKEGEFAFVRGDGEQRVALWSAAEIAPGEHASVLRDVTELVQAQQRLREAKNRAQQYLDVAAVMLLGLDTEGRITLANPQACRALGVKSDKELLGQSWFRFIPDEERDEVRQVFRALLQGDEEPNRRVEGRLVTVAGERRTVLWHNAVVRDEQGQVQGTLSSGQDVTDQREMESQLAQADRLSSMGMLAAGVAHEINNPLAYILYNLESLTEDLGAVRDAARQARARLAAGAGQPDPQLETMARAFAPGTLDDIMDRFRDALGGARRIRDIARGLSTFSRVEQDEPVPVNLMSVIEVAVNMAYNEVKYRARLVKDYGAVPPVLANEGRLSQVFLNLLINATHAIDEGDVEHNEIRIRTWAAADTVHAEVCDTGSGILAEHLPRLFDPFFTTKQVGVGSGLGLAISKGCRSFEPTPNGRDIGVLTRDLG